MLEVLAARGGRPASWAGEDAALGARSTDPGGALAVDEEARLAVAGEARLDGLHELRDVLRLEAATTPMQTVLCAYQRWGDRCVERLEGDFAFAIWDAAESRLVCARDRRGVRQLKYCPFPDGVAFATEVAPLLALPGFERRLDVHRVADLMMGFVEDQEATVFRGVRRLPPAHVLTWTRDVVSVRRYWRLDSQRELILPGDRAYEEAYLEALRLAVSRRLCGDGPVGAFLSGGLDSSAIVCLAREDAGDHPARQLHTFSSVFDAVPECDERRYIRDVLGGGYLEPHEVHSEDLSPLAVAQSFATRDDEPFVNPGLPMHAAVYEAARTAGVAHVLDGEGGDDVTSHGLGRLTELARSGRAIAAVRESHALAETFATSTSGMLRAWVVNPLLPPQLRSAVRRARGRRHPPGALPVPINPELDRQAGVWERVRDLSLEERVGFPRSAREEQFRTLDGGQYGEFLGLTDRVAARLGVEPRYPYHDRELMELGLALPSRLKLGNGVTRVIARRALRGHVPASILDRRDKTSLNPSFARWLRGPDREVVEAALAEGAPIAEFIDIPAARAQLRRYLETGNHVDGLAAWTVGAMARWLELRPA